MTDVAKAPLMEGEMEGRTTCKNAEVEVNERLGVERSVFRGLGGER